MSLWKRITEKLRERYLYAILLVLLLPCVLVVVFVQSTYIRYMDDYILSSEQERAQRIQTEFDGLFNDMKSISDILALNNSFQQTLSPQDYSEVTQVQNLLATMIVHQRYVSNVFILQENSDYILSARGSFQKKIFCSVYGLSEEALHQDLVRGEKSLMEATDALGDYWLYRMQFIQRKRQVTVLFLLDKSELRQLLAEYLTDGTGMFLVRDSSGLVLAQQTNDPFYSQERYNRIEAASWKEKDFVVDEGEEYVLSRSGYSAYGLTVVGVIKGDALSEQARMQNKIWTLMIVSAFLVGLILVIYLSGFMYRPIRSIKAKVENLYQGKADEEPRRGNAYAKINAGIDYLERESRSMRLQLENHQQYLIGRWLNHTLSSDEELNQLCAVLGCKRHQELFCVSLVKTAAGYRKEELQEMLQSVRIKPLRFWVKELYQEGSFVMIGSALKEHASLMKEQLELIRTEDSRIVRIRGNGALCQLEDIPEAFIRGIVLEEKEDALLPEAECRQLRSALGGSAWGKSLKILEGLAPQLETLPQRRFLCLTLALFMPVDAPAECRGDVFEMAQTTNPDFYEHFLKKTRAYIRSQAELSEIGRNQELSLIDRMKRYLSGKYNDPLFSLQEMADEFAMSMPAMSKYFHDSQGIPLNDYLTKLRMDRAKFLLQNTDMSALAISQEVGYANPTSFGRRFRQITGVSPLKYRQKGTPNKEDDGNDSNEYPSDSE